MINCTWLGNVAGIYGVKGHLKLVLDQNINSLEKGTWSFLEIQKKPVPFFIEETWGQELNYVVKLKGIDTPERAKQFLGLKFGTEHVRVVKNNSSNELIGLIGFVVISAETDEKIGEIEDIFDNTAHLLAKVIPSTNSEFMLPLHHNLIVGINEEKREITLQIPEGLLDL